MSKILHIEEKTQNPSEKVSCVIPKKYYRFFEDECFKNRFFSNVKEQLSLVDEVSVLDIVDYIDENFISFQQNDGNNVAYIAAVLREKLDEERERISNHVEILNSKLREQKSFYGRQDELYEIKQCLNSQGYAILSGEPGVGKSEIALYYALNSNANESGEKKYETIIWIKFRESLEETFRDILRYHSNDTYLASKPKAFSIAVSALNNIGKKALVIIERMNIDFRNDIDLSEDVKKFRFDLIITTRSKVPDSVFVPYLHSKYFYRIDQQLREINIDYLTVNNSLACNPFTTIINLLNSNHAPYYKYEIKNSGKFGKQKLTTRAWLNRLYGFYNMPDGERKVLMFLSIFANQPYPFAFVTKVIPICNQVMIDRMVALGWIIISDQSEKMYQNAFPWWKYYHDYPNSISIDEFDGMCSRVERIFNQHKDEEGINSDIYYCGYLALKIYGNDLKWYFLRKEIANRIYLTNQSFSLQIMMGIGSGAEMAFDIANNYTIEANKAIESAYPTLKQYLEVWFSKNTDSKIGYLSTYITDKLSNDIFLINQWAEKFLECYILHTFYDYKEYETCIRHTIEGYRSEKALIDRTKCNEGDFSAVIQDINYAIEPQSSTIYKTLRKYCEKNSIDFPDKKISKLVSKFKELVPMIVLIEKLNDIVCMSQPKSLTQAQLSEVESSIRKYLTSPNNTHALLFCNAMATLYIILGIPDSAESMLDQSQNYVTVSENELMYSITASLVRTKIEFFRCWGQADEDITNDEIMKNIDVISKEFDSLDPIHRLLGRCNFYCYVSLLLSNTNHIEVCSWLDSQSNKLWKQYQESGKHCSEICKSTFLPSNISDE
ncbi:MAG: hypothetical protein J6A19_09690 [Oscillospiraceae bacterium]|nr:hypothetical protein [Oscillospiraceae bacterium]